MALIRLDDFLRISEKLRQGYFSRALEAVLPFSNQTERAWKHVSHPPKHWGSIPRIREHWNECISGSRPVSSKEYVASSYPEFRNTKALSIGCGTGTNEIAWARTGLFREIDAFDLSDTISQIAGVLKPGGHLILRDFVGPSRFQWSETQMKLTEEFLGGIPPSRRRRWHSNTLKTRFYRPGVLAMLLSDPSEAAHSSEILTTLSHRFDTKELKPVGGTICQLVFDDIAHHFLNDDPETLRIVESCIDREMALIADGVIPSDFVFGVFQLRSE